MSSLLPFIILIQVICVSESRVRVIVESMVGPRNRVDQFYSWIILCRAVTRETLDGDPIMFFILKVIFRFLVVQRGVRDQATTVWVRRFGILRVPHLLTLVRRVEELF